MVQMMRNPQLLKIFMGMVGGGMALFAWASVVFPGIRVSWKGGNHALLSTPSRLAMAVAMTSWCLALTGFHPLICAGLFAACVMFGFVQSSRDRAAHDAACHLSPSLQPKMAFSQMWPVLCVFDGLFLVLSLYAVLRDWRMPPQTEEQRILHIMGIGYLVASVLGAIFLYVKRPQKRT
jgi:hypothetical protein